MKDNIQDNMFKEHVCEYHDCEEIATVYIEGLKTWVCDTCSDKVQNVTGYCNVHCQLGYGCDGSC